MFAPASRRDLAAALILRDAMANFLHTLPHELISS